MKMLKHYEEFKMLLIGLKKKVFIDSTVERKKDWLRRRISSIAQERKMLGEKIKITDIKREMSLKPNTFIKYENFLKELIDELNE